MTALAAGLRQALSSVWNAGQEDDVTRDTTQHSPSIQSLSIPRTQGEVSAGAFRNLLEAFGRLRLPLVPDAAHAAAEHQREEVKALIEGHITNTRWRDLLHRAREAAERGEHEYLLLRFPSGDCTDHGRAITRATSDWPSTLTGDAAAIYRHWHEDLRPRGFQLVARIVEFPGGNPGDAGLFLTWHA